MIPYSLGILLENLKSLRKNKVFICAREVISNKELPPHAIMLRFDVERNLPHHKFIAYELNQLNIPATFYFHTRKNTYDVDILKGIQDLGHEIGFHHEALDRCKGNFEQAKELFTQEVLRFQQDGFDIQTVCSHGELGLKKNGYKTNHDLFKKYPTLLKELDLKGEVYLDILGKIEQNYISDTFKASSRFYKKLHNITQDPKLTQILVHPHRWQYNLLKTLIEVNIGLSQAILNRISGHRKYITVMD